MITTEFNKKISTEIQIKMDSHLINGVDWAEAISRTIESIKIKYGLTEQQFLDVLENKQ